MKSWSDSAAEWVQGRWPRSTHHRWGALRKSCNGCMWVLQCGKKLGLVWDRKEGHLLPGMVSVWHKKVPAPEGEQTWQPKSDPRPNALNFGNFEQQDEWVRDAMLCLKNKTKPNKKPRPQTNKHNPPHKTTEKTPQNLKTLMVENHIGTTTVPMICPAMKPEQIGCGRVLRVDYKTPHQDINIPHWQSNLCGSQWAWPGAALFLV